MILPVWSFLHACTSCSLSNECSGPNPRPNYWAGSPLTNCPNHHLRPSPSHARLGLSAFDVRQGKSPFYLPRLLDESAFPPYITKSSIWTPRTHNTGHITSLTGFNEWFSFFSFIFILAEYLKNHSKSYKNRKIENLILLDST